MSDSHLGSQMDLFNQSGLRTVFGRSVLRWFKRVAEAQKRVAGVDAVTDEENEDFFLRRPHLLRTGFGQHHDLLLSLAAEEVKRNE
jgi:hypothetical protein